MTDTPPKPNRWRWWGIAGTLMLITAWNIRSNSSHEYDRRMAWRLDVGKLGVPVYPERLRNVPFLRDIPVFRRVVARREVLVQIEREEQAAALMLAPAPYPENLTIIDAGVSPETRRRIAAQFPNAQLANYPYLPP
jgi:hypothetical protein